MSGSYNDKFVRKILVTGIPEGVTESQVHIHFQKKKNGGGDIEMVTLHSGGRATVVFADPKVATAVVKMEQMIKGKVVQVKLMKEETKLAESFQSRASLKEKQARTISVSGLPEDVTESSVHIHFQRKKNGGGEIEEITLLPGGKAFVVFEDPEVAKMVVEREQIFKGNLLKVNLVEKETLDNNVEKLTTDESSRGKEARTITVFGLPEDATEKGLHIHFQRKKNGGGEIEEVTLLPGGKALVVFEDPEVATTVVNTEQIFKGNVLKVNIKEKSTLDKAAEKLPEYESSRGKEARTIAVFGLPEDATEKGLHIHFQKKKNGGGEIEEVTLLPEGKALVVFEDPEVAKTVCNTEQIFKGNKLEVKGKERDILGEKAKRLLKDENSEEKDARTISVSGLPEDVTENGVHIHFQKKKNGGGDIEEITLLPGGRAFVVFEDPEVAKTVVNKEQILKGNLLEINPLHKKKIKENVNKLKKDESLGETKARTVLVSGLPDDTTESSVFIYFQKTKNSGGEVEKVELLGNGEAIVIFEEPQVANGVVTTQQMFRGVHRLVVKLQSAETQPIAEKSKECVDKSGEQRTVLASDLPDGATENGVHIHFQKKGNGGGEIEKTVLLPGNQALVVFEDSAVARCVVQTPQQMKGKCFSVSLLNQKRSLETKIRKEDETEEKPKKEPGLESEELITSESVGTQEIKKKREETTFGTPNVNDVDQMYARVTASVNPELMTTGLQNFWSDALNDIQSSCGVEYHVSAFGVLVTGSLSQVTRAAETLNLQWKKQCQNDPNFNQSYPTFNQISAAFFDQFQSSGILNQDDQSFNPHISSLTPPNQAFNTRYTANFIDNSFERGQFGSSGYPSVPLLASGRQLYQNSPNYPLHSRLPERMGESHLQNEMHYNNDNSYTIGYRDGHHNQYDPQYEMRYSPQPPPGLSQHTHHIYPPHFGYSSNTPLQYVSRSPIAGETLSDVANTESEEHLTSNHQQFYNRQKDKTTDIASGVDYLASLSSSTAFSSPVNSSDRNLNQTDYNQRSANQFTTERIPKATSADEGAIWPSTANNTTNYQSPGEDQQHSNSIPSFSTGKQRLPSPKPDVYPPAFFDSKDNAGLPSNTLPGNAPSINERTPKSPINDQQTKSNPTAENKDESDHGSVPETYQHPSPSNSNNSAVSNPHVSPEVSENPQQTNNNQQSKTPEPPIEKQTTNNTSSKVESLLHDQANTDQESAPVNVSTPKSLSDDQQDTRYSTTGNVNESPLNDESTDYDKKQTSTSDVTTKLQLPNRPDQSDISSNTNLTTSKMEGLFGEKPEEQSNPAEHIPYNQRMNNQQQDSENLNNKTPGGKPEIKPRNSTETDKNSDKKQKTPVPLPRVKPKPKGRQNAANFSPKPEQPRQDSPLPSEASSDSTTDEPTSASQASNGNDNDETTEETNKLADEDNMEDEVD